MNVSSRFFPNSPKLEIVQLTFGGWMIKQTIYIHTTDYLFSNGKEGTIDICNNVGEPQRNCAKWKKKLISKGYILHDLIYVMFMK